MKKQMNRILLILSTILVSGNALAASDSNGLSLFVLRTGGLALFQSGGNCFTGVIDWMPTYHFNSTFALRAYGGASLVKSKLGEKNPALEYGGLFSMQLSGDSSIEAGFGQTNFVSNGGTRSTVPVNYVIRKPILFFNHIYAGYSAILIPTNLTHSIRIGVGTSF